MDYSTTTTTTTTDGSGAGLIIFAVLFLVYILVLVVLIGSMWKLFTKANKPGWAAIIPFYNIIVMLEIIGRPLWWFVCMFIPFVSIWFSIVLALDLAKSYGKSTLYGVLLILLPIVGFPLLAFGKDTHYVGPVAEGLEGFMPAPDRGPTPGSPVNGFTTTPAYVPPVAAPATTPSDAQPVTATAPVEPLTPVSFGQPTPPAQPQPSQPVAPFQPSGEVSAAPLVAPVQPPVTPTESQSVGVPATPEALAPQSADQNQPTPPQF